MSRAHTPPLLRCLVRVTLVRLVACSAPSSEGSVASAVTWIATRIRCIVARRRAVHAVVAWLIVHRYLPCAPGGSADRMVTKSALRILATAPGSGAMLDSVTGSFLSDSEECGEHTSGDRRPWPNW